MSLPTIDEVLSAVADAVRSEGKAALCQIVRAEGSTPGKVGWKLMVTTGGEDVGNLGGGAFEALVAADARLKLTQMPATPELKRYYLTEEAVRGEPTGMVCGGFADVLIEVVSQKPLMVICGGGPVGQALAANASLCGFDLRVVDDREEFRAPSLFPEGTDLVATDRDYSSDYLVEARPSTTVVVVSRCWETDLAALKSLLRQRSERGIEPEYIGLLGSGRKVERVRDELAGTGHDLDGLALHAPVGLPIGAETPAEIAVSILGEVIRDRKDRSAVADSSESAATLQRAEA